MILFPPTWKNDCANPRTFRQAAMWATRDDSGWNTDEPTPMSDTENRSIPKL